MHEKDRIHDGQAGSRPGRRAIDVIVQKEMKYLYAHLTRTMLGTIDNDAKSCFDRIVCNLAMSISEYYGVPRNFTQMQSTTLKLSKFHIRTALGDSVESYSHSDETPIHGTGQGSCSSPALWLMISRFLVEIFNKGQME
jgi:retron-type reverse transcriptase